MNDLNVSDIEARLDRIEQALIQLQATVRNMNGHLGQSTIKANEGARLSLEVAKAFEYSLLETQVLRRDLDALRGVEPDAR